MSGTFHTTRWSVVVQAQGDSATAGSALRELCATYWYPMYAFLRRAGDGHDDAMDTVQSFCADLLEGRERLAADADRGSFRAYLRGALRHFRSAQERRQRALRRGGGASFLALDGAEAAARYGLEPVDLETPERLFERSFARAVLQRALGTLAAEYDERGRGALFRALRPALAGEIETPRYAALATELQTTEGALKVAVHRLRARLREALRAEVAQTLAEPADVDDELRHLVAVLGS